ncbi:hypothetical protein [Gilvimarinus algae]|uniref:Transposase n=1 Tax=Gilvimarinus algae TaxID=3058037 RepID=A0ABT8TEL9_9GAMM|nr:hypothetical protein [Gilvimarinus sp. SDUM040014]MDO3382386.1 hypothetical protein [Gilvimarinus sp. SDUM040014]
MTTGAALWKPFESDTGRLVRLKFANPLSTLAEVNAMASAHPSTEFPLPGHGFNASEIALLRKYDNEPPLSRFDTHRGRKPIIRNCPQCDALGYHSWLFKMAWLQRCPVHGTPLTILNRIDDEWFHFKDALRASLRAERSGALPEATRRWHLLWKQELLEPKKYFTALLPLAKLSHWLPSSTCQALTLYSSFHQRKHAYDVSIHLDHHQCMAISNPQYPSFVLKNGIHVGDNSIWDLIHREKLVVVNFDDSNDGKVTASDHSQLVQACQSSIDRVETRIMRAAKSANTTDFCTAPASTSHYSKDMNVALVSSLVWRSLMGENVLACQPKAVTGVHLYRQITGPMMPLRPVPMTHGIHSNHSTMATGEEYPLPISVSTLVFELDCWCLYRAIYTYLEAIVSALNIRSMSPIELRDFIPMWAVPGSHYSNRVNVFRRNNLFQVTFPTSYLHLRNENQPVLPSVPTRGARHGQPTGTDILSTQQHNRL